MNGVPNALAGAKLARFARWLAFRRMALRYPFVCLDCQIWTLTA